jgi:SulP family sulfate permease
LILRSAAGDRAVLILTFLLTVFVDLSLAIAAGVVLASLVFARNMASAVETQRSFPIVPDDVDELSSPNRKAMPRAHLPLGVEVFQLNGPFFFAAAAEFEEVLSRSGGSPRVLILRMAGVPLIDTTGAAALKRLIRRADSKGLAIILSELNPEPAAMLRDMDVNALSAETFDEGISLARRVAESGLQPVAAERQD